MVCDTKILCDDMLFVHLLKVLSSKEISTYYVHSNNIINVLGIMYIHIIS